MSKYGKSNFTALGLKNTATDQPTINGEMRYVDGTGFRFYAEGAAFTVGSGGASTAYDDIGDPDANGSIQFAGYTGTYTSTTANWGGLIVSNTHAAPTAGASLLNLDYTANGDANGVFIDCTDNAGADSKFLVGLDGATVIAGTATGTDALTIGLGDLTMSDGELELATGSVTLTAGGVAINTDNVNLTLGASGATDSKIYFDGAGNLTFFDSTLGAKTLTELYSNIGVDPTLVGDVTFSDGSFTWTSGDDEVGGTWAFSNTAAGDIEWTSAATTGECLNIDAPAMTSGSMIYLSAVTATFTGEYIRCYDGAADDFSVKDHGLTTIAGEAAGTDALVVTVGDFLFNDSDQNIIESEDGITTTLLIDNKAGAIGANEAVLTLDAGGTLNADANILTVEFTGTDTNKPVLMEILGGGKDCVGLQIDCDPTVQNVVYVHSDAILAADKAMLTLFHETGSSAAGAALLRITEGAATPNAASYGVELDLQKDMIAIFADSDAVTDSAYQLTHPSANLAAGKSVLLVSDGGTPAADNCYVGHFQFAGTDTAESVILFADGGGKDVVGLLIDVDPVYDAAGYAGHLTLYSDAAGDLPVIMSMIHEDAGAVSGEYCSKMFFYGSDDAPARELYASIEVEMDDTAAANPDGILWIKGDLAGTNTVSAGFTGNTVMLGAAASTLTTAGAWDLTISTALTAANEPRIVLTDGASGDIAITAGGTDGEITLNSPVAHTTTQSVGTADEAINATTSICEIAIDADGTAHGMANGVEGQIKFITVISTAGGTATITPTALTGYATIALVDVGDSCLCLFTNGSWSVISNQGCALA